MIQKRRHSPFALSAPTQMRFIHHSLLWHSWLKQCHSWLLSRIYIRRGSVRHLRFPHLHRFESPITQHCGIHSIWLIRVFVTGFLYDMTHSWLPLYIMTQIVHSCIHDSSYTCHSWLVLYIHGSIYAWTWLIHDSCYTSWLKLYIHVLMPLVIDVIRDSYCMFVAQFIREYDSFVTHVIHHDSNCTFMYWCL